MSLQRADVVVVGGVEVAIEEALFITKFTNSVNLIHRRDEIRATRIMQLFYLIGHGII
jgi:thioredoxin reductase (NADPH)